MNRIGALLTLLLSSWCGVLMAIIFVVPFIPHQILVIVIAWVAIAVVLFRAILHVREIEIEKLKVVRALDHESWDTYTETARVRQ